VEFSEYRECDALDLAALVAQGQVSAAELAATARERGRQVDPVVNAVVGWMDDTVDLRVREALTGPFGGVPFLLKDLYQRQAGAISTSGSRALAGRVAPETDTVVQRWLDAGLVVIGRTNAPEFGAKGVTEPVVHGPARNPWDLSRSPGGSSGGAAAAVAAGIVPVAGANDGGGSIRIPAACCGLFGLKAGRGVVPSGPAHGEYLHGAAVQGVVSRTVRDSAAMLDVMSGADPLAPYSLTRSAGTYLGEMSRRPPRLRIGLQLRSVLNPEPHPDAVAAVEDAAELLTSLGHLVVPAEPVYDDRALAADFLTPWFVMIAKEVEEARRLAGRKASFELDTRVLAALGGATRATVYHSAVDRWQQYVRALANFHRDHDLLLSPTLASPAPLIGEFATTPWERFGARLALGFRAGAVLRRLGIVEQAVLRNLAWVPYTQLANLTGRPAASVPLYWTSTGLPMGVQVVGPLGGETLLLQVAHELEEARPWRDRRPPEAPLVGVAQATRGGAVGADNGRP
jgi:amidase